MTERALMAVIEDTGSDKGIQEGQLGAVNNVTSKLAKASFLVFLGPSGSGKTTLLRIGSLD